MPPDNPLLTFPVDWNELNTRLRPSFLDHVAKMRSSLAYPCIRRAYAHSMTDASKFAEALLGSDPKQRYGDWLADLKAAYQRLGEYGVTGYADLLERIATQQGVETFLAGIRMPLPQFAGLVYFMRYWVIPAPVPARELLEPGDEAGKEYARSLKAKGISTNLDLLQAGSTAEGRRVLSVSLEIPLDIITDLVHRADLRRLPFHSQKSISYLIHGGAKRLADLAAINPQTLASQVMAYGRSIGKDLRYGVEPESSHWTARVLPGIVT